MKSLVLLLLPVLALARDTAMLPGDPFFAPYSLDRTPENGVNHAAEFIEHPLHQPFRKVWDSAAAKQACETRQMKTLMHGPEGETDMEATVALNEKVHRKLAADLAAAMRPVGHVITVAARR